jgi:hypothetical protein
VFGRRPPADQSIIAREKSLPARAFEQPRDDILSISQHHIVSADHEEPRRDTIFENKAQYLRNKRKAEIEALESDLRKQKSKLKQVED